MNAIELVGSIAKKLKEEIPDTTTSNQYAWWLLEKITDKTQSELLTQNAIFLNKAQQNQLDTWLTEIVIYHKPISYVLGSVPFGDLSIIVKPPVLIPRPETEEWILNLVDKIKKSGAANLKILDLCTGSGCIALLCAHLLPDATIYATDICKDALRLAQENKRKINVENVTLVQSDLFDSISQQFDIILSNPPYITPHEYKHLAPSVTKWEHKHALCATDSGLSLITKIIDQAPGFIRTNKKLQDQSINQLYIEIGWQQGNAVKNLMQKRGYSAITVDKDSAQKDRVVSGRIVNVAVATHK